MWSKEVKLINYVVQFIYFFWFTLSLSKVPISPFSSANFCFIYFEAIYYMHKNVAVFYLPGGLTRIIVKCPSLVNI